ncbi:MAG: ribonuclease D [SAR86 cluster bacterium]|uniref:Ribonuclease D n=1 Tax=SAR86 cluster bacterium TaxID=2030880 RepID=A0A2A5AFS6_9GAMM|nr:MAG: ribonuclease D [SAR86 cluster bacterium]
MTDNADGMPVHYIEDTAAFELLCEQWRSKECLVVDTEFIRTNTFYARMGLLQIADDEAIYLIDPLRIDNWEAFTTLLNTPSCCFVIHSCSEDLNLLQTFLGCLPASLFDTQLAASFLGLGFSVSYQALVSELIGIDVAKGETRSNWLQRPLTESQLLYAANDVRYLLELYNILKQQLVEKNRLQWLDTECMQLLETAQRSEVSKNWEFYYTGISNAWRLNDSGLEILQKLCYWREHKARNNNKPRSWIVKDAELLSLTKQLSLLDVQSLTEMPSISEVDARFLSRYSGELLQVLKATDSDLGEIDREILNKPLGPVLRKKLKQCQEVVQTKAAQLEMAPELIGRKKQLLEFLRDFERAGEIVWSGGLSGWRRQLLEPDFQQIMSDEN